MVCPRQTHIFLSFWFAHSFLLPSFFTFVRVVDWESNRCWSTRRENIFYFHSLHIFRFSINSFAFAAIALDQVGLPLLSTRKPQPEQYATPNVRRFILLFPSSHTQKSKWVKISLRKWWWIRRRILSIQRMPSTHCTWASSGQAACTESPWSGRRYFSLIDGRDPRGLGI